MQRRKISKISLGSKNASPLSPTEIILRNADRVNQNFNANLSLSDWRRNQALERLKSLKPKVRKAKPILNLSLSEKIRYVFLRSDLANREVSRTLSSRSKK